jgi:chromosomal replication initiation ATPase DnaA
MSVARQLAFELPVREARGREDFLVADCNAEAVAWLDRWPAWPAFALCVHGPSGCGKSHLLEVWRRQSGAPGIDGAELTGAVVVELLDAGAVAVDNADRISDHAALFHLYNGLREGRGYLLLSGERAPARWPVELPDLVSRLSAMDAVGVDSPDDELLSALLAKLFADRQVAVGADVVAYLLKRMDRSHAAARDMVTRLDRAGLSDGRAITVALARAVLEETSKTQP